MQENDENNKIILPHHEQQSLCTTRLPYRQGRKLTAVKVYSITKESNHLLIFGIPSLNLRQEIKGQFIKFGKLLKFNLSSEHLSESFTETYHAQYDKIQSARLAKRMLVTKNFYGGSLHVCYAPEFETVDETRQKLVQRQRDVIFRLKNLEKEEKPDLPTPINEEPIAIGPKRLNMGEVNTISVGDEVREVFRKRKRKTCNKKGEPCFIRNELSETYKQYDITESNNTDNKVTISHSGIKYNEIEQNKNSKNIINDNNIEIVDCTGVNADVITNINENLNYKNFGNEIIKNIPEKPVHRIHFHLNKRT